MSSLLGVWQSVPYLFSDLWSMLAGRPSEDRAAVDTSSLPYRGFLIFLAASSVAGLLSSFVRIQKIYAILGALFIPMLAFVLLLLNSREDLVGSSHRNRLSTRLILAATLVLFLSFGMMEFSPWG